MRTWIWLAVISGVTGCLQPVAEPDAGPDTGEKVLFTLEPTANPFDGTGWRYWWLGRDSPRLTFNLPAGNIFATDGALFIDGFLVPAKWDGGLLPIHPDEPSYTRDGNCLCDGWLREPDRALKPSAWLGFEELWFVPYYLDGAFAEPRWGHSTGLPQRGPLDEGTTIFGLAVVRGSASQLCVSERPSQRQFADGGSTPRDSVVRIYQDLALTTPIARADFLDAGANCIDATVADGGVLALVGERFAGSVKQAWRVLRVSAGSTQVEALPDAQLCFPFKIGNDVGVMRFVCHLGREVIEWQVDMNESVRTHSYSLPEGWEPTAGLSEADSTLLALSRDAGMAAICDEGGCRPIADWSPNRINVGIDSTNALILAMPYADAGIRVTRYSAERWRRR